MFRARFLAIAPLLLASLLPLGGCASTADDESTTEDDLSYAALRIHAEGSPEAKAILRAANEMVPDDLGFCTPTACEMDRGFFDAVETQKLLAFRAKGKPFTTLTQVIRTMAKPGVNNSQYVQGRFLDVAILRGWYEPFDAQALFALAEGSPEAVGIVRAANEIAGDKLGRGKSGQDFVMLDWIVADAVGAVRKGADGVTGTADDGHFSTLADVRAAIFSPEVQRRAAPKTQRSRDMYQGSSLAQLLRMAKLRKWLGPATPPPPPVVSDPFDPASCQGAGLTVAAAQSKFGPGQTKAALGEVSVNIRSRDCNPISGCTPWKELATAPFQASSSYARFTKSLTGFPEKGSASLSIESGKVYFGFQTNGRLYEPSYSTSYSFHLTGCELGTGRWCQFMNTEAGAQFEQWGIGPTPYPYSPAGFSVPTDLANTITDHCARLVMTNTVQPGQTGTEYQLVVSGKY